MCGGGGGGWCSMREPGDPEWQDGDENTHTHTLATLRFVRAHTSERMACLRAFPCTVAQLAENILRLSAIAQCSLLSIPPPPPPPRPFKPQQIAPVLYTGHRTPRRLNKNANACCARERAFSGPGRAGVFCSVGLVLWCDYA